ncbi:glycosyltransferase family 4 protein [Nitrogeniibacter mangrovi]|uniref:Glycosyltransferase family 4 protein n=2 Tax=Nitrogeniibacter mangrovi TaxID=2016596 RepID=A0A6C1B8Z7_9RHOO|nr:glycosyltransferase family 4 protein [Nitrogeniibacter mangrovi]
MGFDGLRIALVGPLPPPAGGMANQTRQLAELLSSEGARVELVQTNAPYRPAWAGRMRGLRALFRLVPYLVRLWTSFGRADVAHVMANSGWSWHLFAAPAIWVARLRGVPVVVNYRGGEAESFLERSANAVSRTMARADALVVPSGFLAGIFDRFGMTSRIVPNIIDAARFRPADAARVRGHHIVIARNLESIYGIDVALRAFARVRGRVPEAWLSIAGSGPQADALRDLTNALALADVVRFTGRLDRDEMAALYRSADVSLNPSHVDNMPNSVLESMACGVPVVSTRVGGVPFIVEDGRTGLLVPPGDDEAMANAIVDVLTDPALHQSLSVAGIDEVRRYEWPQVRAQWLSVYRSVCKEAAPVAVSGARGK